MLEFVVSQIPGILFGAIGGAVGMFFIARKNPKAIEDIYQKQRSLSMQGTEEVDKLKSKVKELELSKELAELKEKIAKLGG